MGDARLQALMPSSCVTFCGGCAVVSCGAFLVAKAQRPRPRRGEDALTLPVTVKRVEDSGEAGKNGNSRSTLGAASTANAVKVARASRDLYDSIWIGNFEGAFSAVEAGADLAKGFGPRKITALHVAARAGNRWILEMLLKSGRASINIQNLDGETPLFGAVSEGHVATTQLLVEARADVNHRDGSEGTALALAKARGRQKFVDYLVAQGANE